MSAFPPASKRILIVDDDAQTRQGLAMAIEAAGHAVRTAANGLEALKEVRTCRPDLILLDLVMPTTDGRAFPMRQLSHPELADIPVVILSGAGAWTVHQAELLGASAWLAKPAATGETLDLMGDLFEVLDQAAAAVP